MKKYIIYLFALAFDVAMVYFCNEWFGLNPLFWLGVLLLIDIIIYIIIAKVYYKIPLGFISQSKAIHIILMILCLIFILSAVVEKHKKNTNYQKICIHE